MDDPWGSPWADESLHPLPKLDKPVSKESATPGKASGSAQDSNLPWDDSDGFGEWATLPVTDELQSNEQDGPEQAEIVEWNDSVDKEFAEGKDHIRPDGSSWFSRQIQPINGVSLGLEISQVTGRALSPDPWAQGAAGAEERIQSRHAPESNVGEQPRIVDTDEDGAQNRSVGTRNRDEHGTPAIDDLDKAAPTKGDGKQSIGESSINHDQDNLTASPDNTSADVQTGDVTHGESLASRPSSSPSDHSHHDEVLTESPRTSFEEDDKRPKLERERSSNVKEMVRLFDGLTPDEGGTEVAGHLEPVNASDDRFGTPVAAQSGDDFGDFEEGISYVTTTADTGNHVSTAQEEKSRDTVITPGISDIPPSTAEHITKPSNQPLEPPVQFRFEADLSLLSRIFGQTPDAEYIHADPKQAPEIDNVMEDSFSSTNERKTWYRISRFGTMRKHNAGDEDSYVRINWKDSEVRAETLKVVERWIEEDRLGGGVILGGGTRLGSMFGWGQKNGTPMSVAAALASKCGKTGTHSGHNATPTSNRNSDTSPIHMSGSSRKSLEQLSASMNSFQSPASATAPQFSWSTGTPISATTEVMLPIITPPMTSPKSNLQTPDNLFSNANVVHESSSCRLPIPNGLSVTSKSVSTQLARPEVNVRKLGESSVTQQALEPPNRRCPTGDDDWGVMVSSPALENPPPVNAGLNKPRNSGTMELSSIALDHASERRSSDRMTTPKSGSEAFIAASVEDHTTTPNVISSTTSESDAWATADFSFFDSPAPPKPTPASLAIDPKASSSKPIPFAQNHGPSRGQAEQAEQDRIVKSIVQNLPDLSYMLRR